MKEYNICVIKGDGIGPEIVEQAQRVLDTVGEKYGASFNYTEALLGGSAIDATGVPLPSETIELAKKSDAVLMGSIGGDPKVSPWYQLPADKRPEAGLLCIRKALGLFANLRPASLYPALRSACPLKDEISQDGFDMVIVRELTGGVYFGEHSTKTIDGKEVARDVMDYSEDEVRRIAKIAFDAAQKRDKKLCSVDKANVLDTSRLWRKIVDEVAKDYPDVTYSHMFVDNAAMQLVRNPRQFDVILTENMFGDILSDEASELVGSLGMLPSASLSEGGFGLYEPSGGSAPDIAGKGIANPIATILSVAMMLKYSFGMNEASDLIEKAVAKVVADGVRTVDIKPVDDEGFKSVSTQEMGDAIIAAIKSM